MNRCERLSAIIDFELFRPELMRGVPRSAGAKGGRPPFDLVSMFRVLARESAKSNLCKGEGASRREVERHAPARRLTHPRG